MSEPMAQRETKPKIKVNIKKKEPKFDLSFQHLYPFLQNFETMEQDDKNTLLTLVRKYNPHSLLPVAKPKRKSKTLQKSKLREQFTEKTDVPEPPSDHYWW